MKLTGGLLLALFVTLVLAGCVSVTGINGGQPTTPTQPTSPTSTSALGTPPPTRAPTGQPTLTAAPPSSPTSSPADALVTVSISDAGDSTIYTGAFDPSCSHGVIGADVWGVEYGDMSAGPTQLSSVRVIDEPDSSDAGHSRIVSIVVTVGAIFSAKTYIVSGDRFSGDDFSYGLNDAGATAVIHARGVTVDSPLGGGGLTLEMTVSCPSVARG